MVAASRVRLKIDAVLCGPVSVGTISVVYAVMKHAELESLPSSPRVSAEVVG